MNEAATLIILAGGKSNRMGSPKHLLFTPHGTLIDSLVNKLSKFFVETLLVGRNLDLEKKGVRIVEDVRPEQCPLVGIYSGLCAAKTDLTFILACDLPFVKPKLVQYLLFCANDVDIVVPVINGYYEPLCAAYRRAAIPVIQETLDRDIFKITKIYDRLRLRKVSEQEVKRFDSELSSFVNLNTPRQLQLLSSL